MARPRKFQDEVKVEEQVPVKATETVEEVTFVSEVELKDTALSVIKNKKTGMWHVAIIKFDAETGTLGSIELSKEGNERSITLERFKIEAGKVFWVET